MALMNETIQYLADITDESAKTFDLGYALLARVPAPVAARALVAICDEHGIDWAGAMGAAADEVARLAGEDERTLVRVPTPYGDLVARGYDDDGAYMGIVVDLEKPDGTSGQVSITEAVAGGERDIYRTPVHTFAWDGVQEDCAAETDLHPDGPEMAWPYRGSER
ncbi:MAG: hypothetical protein MSA61_10575 [Coriobacteriaceae bacterium]|uniref:hypothetical protein n=1 Tax=Tractidigestivibacter sp. TaxID=2847320 RepID=UPI002A807C7D|nr:hypothetical protein [Tractidigestivibacter sp.]MCI7439651.1 hypothetical protein [Coriobacteriaceae bacterium]MDY4533769.1 hypothetical protein [Tractidigestivibacter sp.]